MFEATLAVLSLCIDELVDLAPRLVQHLPNEIAGEDAQSLADNQAIGEIHCHGCRKTLKMALRYAASALRHPSARRAQDPARCGQGERERPQSKKNRGDAPAFDGNRTGKGDN